MGEVGNDFNFVTPGSVTDFAKAVRELIKMLGDVAKLTGSIGALYDRGKAKVAAKNLATLSFSKAGFLGPLDRIAAGTGSTQDIEEIARKLADTAGEVEESILSLGVNRDRVRQIIGLERALKVEAIIDGPTGKRMIRHSLYDLVELGKKPEPDIANIQSIAKQIVGTIESLNRQLIELHDLLVPPRKIDRC